MRFLRTSYIQLRRLAERSRRQAALQKLAASGKAPLYSVFYHRVSDHHRNQWTISCGDFQDHVDYIRRRLPCIDLAELQRRSIQRDSHQPAIAFTFDDGYAENCQFALPLLLKHRIPCTYFVSLQHVLTGQSFPHDIQCQIPLPVNTIDELKSLAAEGIEIGLHARHHVDLSGVTDPRVLESEIVAAARELSSLLKTKVRYFAFPYGMPAQLTPQAIAAVAEAGMQGFCSAFGAYNIPGRDTFHIRRFHGDAGLVRLRNWLDFDLRKLKSEPLISYRLPTENAAAACLPLPDSTSLPSVQPQFPA